MNTASEFGQREAGLFAEWVDSGISRVRAVMLRAVEQASGQEISCSEECSGAG